MVLALDHFRRAWPGLRIVALKISTNDDAPSPRLVIGVGLFVSAEC